MLLQIRLTQNNRTRNYCRGELHYGGYHGDETRAGAISGSASLAVNAISTRSMCDNYDRVAR